MANNWGCQVPSWQIMGLHHGTLRSPWANNFVHAVGPFFPDPTVHPKLNNIVCMKIPYHSVPRHVML
jgi:hypothetical protein